ncbi:citrate lyase holo-[acyl-carrier protein] synthase [Geomonas sp. RF6]|uniref:citrate lyase holo-[acyl-carrier protein] synthase n=1 Tax=Geomonas sp. RF6 TaxID=2897342 RepID=UPI001E518CAF|nr:citrate lyase holo-[acyl-carrier protein] synthase [Geomonas sp. RF6]UFS71982.1 citrate lyase holo-[acyl-carrier protein] synthase [Geomonas sp. RF6]
MSLDVLESSILAARDRRQAQLESFAPHSPCLIMLSLNIPGPEKSGERAQRLFNWALTRLADEAPVELLFSGTDPLGPYALYQTRLTPRGAKEKAVAIEGSEPAGRLIDLDVYDTSGSAFGRSLLGLAPRRCLVCGESAAECMRLKRHETRILQEEVDALIDAL